MAEGTSRLSGVLDSEDVRSSLGAVSKLGAKVNLEKLLMEACAGGTLGLGREGLSAPSDPIDCAIPHHDALAHGNFGPVGYEVELTGDDSLRRRPMPRFGPAFEDGRGVFARRPRHAAAYDPWHAQPQSARL